MAPQAPPRSTPLSSDILQEALHAEDISSEIVTDAEFAMDENEFKENEILYYIIPTEDTNVSCNLYNVPKPFMIPQIDGHDTMVSQDIIFNI